MSSTFRSLGWLFVVAPSVVTACVTPAPDSAAERDIEAAALSAATGGEMCSAARLRVYEESPGVLERLYVDLPHRLGHSAVRRPFLIDTGLDRSYRLVRTEEHAGSPPATAAPLTCDTSSWPARSGFGERTTPDDIPLGGKLGGDLLAAGSAFDLRIADGIFGWTRTPSRLAPGAITLPASFHVSDDPWAANMLTVTGARLDGAEVELLVDTGSPHMLIISPDPRPNEEIEETSDGNGEPVTLYISSTTVAFGDGPPRAVTLDRAAHFPSLEKTFKALGGKVTGILGLGALGNEHIVISKDRVSFVPPAPTRGR